MEISQNTLKNLPHEPGVYLYRNRHGQIIYVGKAVDLARRVRQYFRSDITDEKTARLVSKIVSIATIPTTSEFDALLLEAKLIRKHLPKYNVVSRDDKSPLYVVITLSEVLPRLVLVRKGDVRSYEQNRRNRVYGPFQSGHALQSLLRQLRSIVPYCTEKVRRGKPCFYTHLGLCDPCPGEIVSLNHPYRTDAIRRYRKNILRLRALFEGKNHWLANEYEKEIRELARQEMFEKASEVKERIARLKSLSYHRYDPLVFLERGVSDIYEEELRELFNKLQPYYANLTALRRIECFDISNLFGTHATGSMVVLENGRPEKSGYRRFRIKTVRGISDVGMMKEVLMRRFAHTEWEQPDFVLVDGGKPQVAAAKAILSKSSSRRIPFAGLAKREEELIIPKVGGGFVRVRLPLSGQAIKVLMRVRDEAHRFAITYHRRLRDKIV